MELVDHQLELLRAHPLSQLQEAVVGRVQGFRGQRASLRIGADVLFAPAHVEQGRPRVLALAEVLQHVAGLPALAVAAALGAALELQRLVGAGLRGERVMG
jgi:hypothetical protein